jgi:hypothetical protein
MADFDKLSQLYSGILNSIPADGGVLLLFDFVNEYLELADGRS